MAKSIYSCEQIWQGKIITSADRDQFKLSKDDFRTLFLEDPKYQSQIKSINESSIGNGMYLFDIEYKISPKTVHIVYQDLRSGQGDNDNRKRFQLGSVAIRPNEAYFYIGGYNTGDNALLVSIVTHMREINEGITSLSSIWFDWDKIKEIHTNGILMWNQAFRNGTINMTVIGCNKSNYDFLHKSFISRSLDHYVPVHLPSIPCIPFIQKIFYGAPGGGKSYRAKEETAGKEVFRITFHPDTDYAAFVGAYKPVPKVVSGTEKISYEFVPQVFTEAYIEAWKQYLAPKEESKEKKAPEVCLLIEELNRGNCAQIFGDLFQLLDRSKSAFSEYSVLPSSELAHYIRAQMNDSAFEAYYKAIRENSDRTENGSYCIPAWDGSDINRNQLRLCLPPNLSIVCTMNTSDQSLFPMDSAFKRRWDWEYVPIQYKCPKSQFTINLDDSHKYDWNVFLEKINGIINEQTKSEDKQMGNFFVKGDENNEVSCEQFVSKVMFYLWSEICKDNPKARKEIFVAAASQADGTETTEEFTFNDLFSIMKVNLLSGFMEHLGIENIADVIGTYDPTETAGESEKDRWEHEIYMEGLIAYINNASSTPYSDFKTTFKIPDKPHGNGFVVRPDYGGWISLSRNKDVNLVCYGNGDSNLMEQIFDQYGTEIETKLGIPKNRDSKKRSESRWLFTGKQGQAKLASPHNLNKEKEYEWFVSKALEMNELFHEYVTKISTI